MIDYNQPQYLAPFIQDKRVPLYYDNQKYSNCTEIFRAHWHEHIEFIFMKEGSINIICNGNSNIANAGDLIIINPNDVHHLQSRSDFVNFDCLIFDLSMIRNSITDNTDYDYIEPLLNNQLVFNHIATVTPEMEFCKNSIAELYNSTNPLKSLVIKSRLYELIYQIFSNLPYTELTPNKIQKRNYNLKLIQNIIIYLNKNYTENINVKELADLFNISYHHLCHLFKEYTNSSIIQYITTVRVDRSLTHLKYSDSSISEIAGLVGYDDANYFSRTFKKVMNMSPKEYIKSVQ